MKALDLRGKYIFKYLNVLHDFEDFKTSVNLL